jgi:hypothetical protein
MIYRRLDSNGDYILGSGHQTFVSGVDAVRQAIYTRLKLLLEEWWEDRDDGLPLFQSILGARVNSQQAIDTIIRDRIRGTTDVTDVFDFTSTFDVQTRTYRFQCQVDTAYGEIAIDEEVTL